MMDSRSLVEASMIPVRLLRVLLSAAFGLTLLGAMATASAKLVTWHLQNVTFEHGGTATGSFTFNTEGHPLDYPYDLLDSYDVKVSGGTYPFIPFQYIGSNRNSFVHSTGVSSQVILSGTDEHGGRVLTLNFPRPLPDGGGAVPICYFESTLGDCLIPSGFRPSTEVSRISNSDITRLATFGAVATIPELSEPLCFAFGIGVLFGFAAWRTPAARKSTCADRASHKSTTFNRVAVSGEVVAIPEPSQWGFLAAGGAVLLLWANRYFRVKSPLIRR
jgi:hypothetical protein